MSSPVRKRQFSLDARPQFALFYAKLISAESLDPITSLIRFTLTQTGSLQPGFLLSSAGSGRRNIRAGKDKPRADLTPTDCRQQIYFWSMKCTANRQGRQCVIVRPGPNGFPVALRLSRLDAIRLSSSCHSFSIKPATVIGK